MPSFLRFATVVAIFLSIASCRTRPVGIFQNGATPSAPDYSQDSCWAALPWMKDKADLLPEDRLADRQATSAVDIFFIHPTSYTQRKGHTDWNGAIDNTKLNKRTDEGAIKYQASIFNGVGRIFAPRYRQAHIYSYTAVYEKTERAKSAMGAFKLAYTDVATSFAYYLKNHNQGRPIIIAAHSQGSTHGIALMKQFFDGKPLQKQLVAAYLVGMPVAKDTFKTIPPCTSPEQTGCFCSWRTVKRNKHIDWYGGPNVAVTNPLSWRTDTSYVPASVNEGAVIRPFEKIIPEATDAQITSDGFLWAKKPRFSLSFLWTPKNYHIADYNFYYMNVRKNAKTRVEAFK